ncbi:MAG: hypothetical protein CMF23_07890 [Ignavibacteriae bacterium]|mgnify:FL=1|nr:hypothetical protein [Ignavibacteriota bacterium]|tara:strand:- start:410 stop:778 length:369 start_codon:yes stop_codon:yes gene_type:complete
MNYRRIKKVHKEENLISKPNYTENISFLSVDLISHKGLYEIKFIEKLNANMDSKRYLELRYEKLSKRKDVFISPDLEEKFESNQIDYSIVSETSDPQHIKKITQAMANDILEFNENFEEGDY